MLYPAELRALSAMIVSVRKFRVVEHSTCVSGSITTELDDNPCFANGLAIPDAGNGECPIVDVGAYELLASCPWDLDCNGNVGITDFFELLVNWGTRFCLRVIGRLWQDSCESGAIWA